MKAWKNWLMGKLTMDDLFEYFNSIGIRPSVTFRKRRSPRYYAKNSRLYKRTFKGEESDG